MTGAAAEATKANKHHMNDTVTRTGEGLVDLTLALMGVSERRGGDSLLVLFFTGEVC